MELVLKGTRLAKRHAGPYYIYLYNVRELYVEVFYDADTDIIEFIKAFRSLTWNPVTNLMLTSTKVRWNWKCSGK